MTSEYEHLIRKTPEEMHGEEYGAYFREIGITGYIPTEINIEDLISIAGKRGHRIFLIGSSVRPDLPPMVLFWEEGDYYHRIHPQIKEDQIWVADNVFGKFKELTGLIDEND